CHVYWRQLGNVCDIESRSFSHNQRSRMQMADEPNDRGGKSSQKNEKHEPTFAPFFAHRTRSPGGSARLDRLSTVQRERDLKSFFGFVASYAFFRCLRPRSALRDRPSFCNHAF